MVRYATNQRRRARSFGPQVKQPLTTIGVFTVANADDFDAIVAARTVDETPRADSKTKQRWVKALKLFDVAGVGLHETIQRFQQSQSRIPVYSSDVVTCRHRQRMRLAIRLGLGGVHVFELGQGEAEIR